MDLHLSIELITERDRDEVLSFLRNHFMQDEPMNESLDLGECKELEYFCWKSINDELSYKAIDANGNCVGVFISGLDNNRSNANVTKEDDADDLIYRKHEKFYRIIQLTEELDRKVNLREKYPNLDWFVFGKVLSVDGKYRGLGIAGKLIDRTFQEMAKRNLPMMSIQTSSFYSARVMHKLDFELVAKIAFKDFYLNGQQAMAPKLPHVEICAFVKWINQGEGNEGN